MKKFKKIVLASTVVFAVGLSSTSFAIEPAMSDIDTHWAKESISNLIDIGYASGYQDGTFKPNKNITVAESLAMILKSMDINISENAIANEFQKGKWHDSVVFAAIEKSIIDRNEFSDFDRPITRAELCKIIAKVLEQNPEAGKTAFVDDNAISNEYKGYIKKINELKIINGYPDNSFKPNGQVTRAEICVVVTKMIETKERLKEVQTNIDLTKREVEKLLPIPSSAKYENPKNYEELKENLDSLKVYPYSTSTKRNCEIVDVYQIANNINNYHIGKSYGAIRMEWPKYQYEFKDLEFEGKIYNQFYCDQLIEDEFESGFLVKDGNIIDMIGRVGGYKSNLVVKKHTLRGYYTLAIYDRSNLEKADYIIFSRLAKYYIPESKLPYPRDNTISVVFDNPFKKDIHAK